MDTVLPTGLDRAARMRCLTPAQRRTITFYEEKIASCDDPVTAEKWKYLLELKVNGFLKDFTDQEDLYRAHLDRMEHRRSGRFLDSLALVKGT